MKTIFSICFALISLNTFGQRTLKQLKDRLQRQPQNSSVEVISQVNDQIMTIDTFQIDTFSPQVDFNQLKIIKYNDIIQEVSPEEEVIYKDKLSWNLTGNRINIIPEFHLEIPEDSEVGEPPLIFSPIFTNLKPLIYDHEQENGYKSILTFMLFAENGEDGQKVKSPVHLEINSSRLDSFPKRFTMHH
ncbi:MAG TPA: hypothetical protein VK941_02845, partial [Gillisia sp.]|nr:hypothetical protein [Gillisia sp.]